MRKPLNRRLTSTPTCSTLPHRWHSRLSTMGRRQKVLWSSIITNSSSKGPQKHWWRSASAWEGIPLCCIVNYWHKLQVVSLSLQHCNLAIRCEAMYSNQASLKPCSSDQALILKRALCLQGKAGQISGEEENPHLSQRQSGRQCDWEQSAWHSKHSTESAAAAGTAARGHDPCRAAEDECSAVGLLHWAHSRADSGGAPGCHALLLGRPARGDLLRHLLL